MLDRPLTLQRLTLLTLLLLQTACTSSLARQPRDVQPAQVPALPVEARQRPAPAWCSPTCSQGLMRERESWQRLMTEQE